MIIYKLSRMHFPPFYEGGLIMDDAPGLASRIR
jgi:hypothetical protein